MGSDLHWMHRGSYPFPDDSDTDKDLYSIRPLEWQRVEGDGHSHRATTVFGEIRVGSLKHAAWWSCAWDGGLRSGSADSLDDARKIAEMHYVNRLIEALEKFKT